MQGFRDDPLLNPSTAPSRTCVSGRPYLGGTTKSLVLGCCSWQRIKIRYHGCYDDTRLSPLDPDRYLLVWMRKADWHRLLLYSRTRQDRRSGVDGSRLRGFGTPAPA